MTSPIPVFDGHNDVLLRLYKSTSTDPVADFLQGEEAGHIDMKKARAGSFAGGLFALYSPSPRSTGSGDPANGGLSRSLPPPLQSLRQADGRHVRGRSRRVPVQ